MTTMENAKNFNDLAKATIHRKGIDELLEWLDSTDFFEAPASTKYHGAFAGGLCQHSMNVQKRLLELAEMYCPEQLHDPDAKKVAAFKESISIVALFHDVCKAGCYKVSMRNVKNADGQWERVPFFMWNEDDCFGGHGSKSVYLVQRFMPLSFEEAAAINSHMGFADQTNISSVSSAYEKNVLAWMLHVADEAATYLDKC